MSKLVPAKPVVIPGPETVEDCAACKAPKTSTYKTVICGIDMALCINWKECCHRMDAAIIKAARDDTKRRSPFHY